MLGVMEEHIFNEFTYSNLLRKLSINGVVEPFMKLDEMGVMVEHIIMTKFTIK